MLTPRRSERWRPAPEPASSRTAGDCLDDVRLLELGQVMVSVLTVRGRRPVRISRLLPRPRPGTWQLSLVCGGVPTADRDPEGVLWDPGYLVLRQASHPLAGVPAAGESGPLRAVALHLPQEAVGVPGRALRMLAGRPVPVEAGPGALVARFLKELPEHGPTRRSASADRLGSAALDLAAVFLGELAHARGLVPQRPGKAELLAEIKSFIIRNLRDPCSSPVTIAGAHAISVRYLHELFRQDDRTVASFLRHQRLEHCRADLASRDLAGQSVMCIARSWGFTDPAVFGRTFKKAYGLPPGEYRRRTLDQ